MTHQTIDTATRVDVLAVMDRLYQVLADDGYSAESILPLEEARNAVAELIESANVVVIADRDGWLGDDIMSRLANALAKATGETP